MTDKRRPPAEPYGYNEPGYPPGSRRKRPDGYEPYRERRDPPRADKAKPDNRAHPKADEQHYGEEPNPTPPGKPPLPSVKTQR